MKALRFHRFGEPDVLRLEDLPMPRATADQAIVAVKAASINPSDVGNLAGRFQRTTLPRTPGRDYSGVVVDGAQEWLGAEVWGTGDGGVTLDGSHADHIAVPVASLRRKPMLLSHEQAASIGVTFLAGWIALVEYARLVAGETLVVIGAAGGVGGAGVQIGARVGARVIGLDRIAPDPASPAARRAERIETPEPAQSAALIRDLTGGRGADVVLNAVGGATFEPSLDMLAPRGRLCVLTSPGEPRQSFNLVEFYHNESQLLGVDTLARDMVASAMVLEGLAAGFEDRAFEPPVIAQRATLDRGVDAYRAVAAGARGRVVLTP